MDKVYAVETNISHTLKTPNHSRIRYHQSGDFDVLDWIISQHKWQPDTSTNLKEGFEEENEPRLHRITGDIVIIKDNQVIYPLD